ncbi:hypothetical protein BWI17_07975 [Betaproteobacteria bacterium GR16-43]|nr:hypothetical protein BWI17_07975 [Betaproteobacteria bacterium GR16-43]
MRISFGSLARRVSGWTLFAALLLPLPSFAVPSITVTGTLTAVDANNNECTYASLMEDSSGNWTLLCSGTGGKKFRFSTPPLSGGSCTSFGEMTEDPSGNWTVKGCQSPCVPTVTLTAFPGTSIPVGAPYGLTATASANCGRTIAKVDYQVDSVLISGPSGATAAPYTWNWTPATDKVYSVVAIATDSGGGVTTSSARTIRANAGPTGVTVSVSPTGTRAAPATFTLTSTATDADGIHHVEYRTVAGLSIGSPTVGPNYSYTWTPVAAGTYQVFARAVDGLQTGTTDSAPVTVVVSATNNPPSSVTIVTPAENQVVTGPVNLTATATDSDGNIVRIDYFDLDQSAVLVVGSSTAGPSYQATWNAAPGVRHITAMATDNTGATSNSSVRTFTVQGNTAPVMSYDAATGSVISGFVGSPIVLRVVAQDAESSSVSVQFTNVVTGQLIGSGILSGSNVYSYTWSTAPEGIYHVRATASDGTLSSSEDLWVTVLARPAATSVAPPGGKATSNVGAIAANFAVSGGAATYSIPIAVPPGPAGMQPSLAISYNSQGGNGPLGMGWGLSGTSSITRCPATVAANGYKAGINYDDQGDNDVYCLDGQRLIPVVPRQTFGTGEVCGDLKYRYRTEFRTEIDSYSRIIAYEDAPCLLLGPTRFEVLTKSGQWMMFGLGAVNATAYGDGDTGAVVMSRGYAQIQAGRWNQAKIWPLTRVIDAAGNLMRFEYCGEGLLGFGPSQPCDSSPIGPITNAVPPYAAFPPSEHHLKAIYYGGHANASRVTDSPVKARVDFRYGLRWYEDQIRAFDSGGGEATLKYALYSITTSTIKPDESTGQYAQIYILDYEIAAASRRYRLKEIKQCAPTATGDPGTCLFPTRFEYSAGAAMQFQDAPFLSLAYDNRSALLINDAGDIDGDGRSDLVFVEDGANAVWVALSSENFSWRTQPLGGAWTATRGSQRYLADFNGDGKADLIMQHGNDLLYCNLNLPTGGVAFCSSPTFTGPAAATGNFYLQGDFDGDGRIDILIPRGLQPPDPLGSRAYKWTLHLGGPTGPQGSVDILNLTWPDADELQIADHFAVGDFNGDGRADILVRRFGKGCGTGGGVQQGQGIGSVTDACGAADTKVAICLSRPATSSGGVVFECGDLMPRPYAAVLTKSVTVDFNGDGLADFAYPVPIVYPEGGVNRWMVCLSSGEGTFEKTGQTTSVPYGTASMCKYTDLFVLPSGVGLPDHRPKEKVVFGDFDGDGKSDIATHIGGGVWRVCLSRTDDITATGNANPVRFTCQDWSGGFDPLGDEANQVLAGDFNGDGKTDLLRYGKVGKAPLVYSMGTVPDLLTKVTTGLGATGVGATTEIEYKPITDSTVYSKNGVVAGTDEVVVQSPMYVVSKTKEDNAIGGTFDHTYAYTGLKGGTNGRGMLGFETVSVTDANGLVRKTTYNQSLSEWWRAGRPARVQSYPEAIPSRNLSDTRMTWTFTQSGGVYQVNLQRTLEAKVDLNGAALPCTSMTTPSVDEFGNPALVYSESGTCNIGTGFFDSAGYEKKTTTNTYSAADTGTNWMLKRLLRATVTHEATGKAAITRTSSFEYQGIGSGACTGAPYGHLCVETIEPDEPQLGDKRHETRYEYDGRGNRTRSTRTFFEFIPGGGTLSTRTTLVEYETTGRFPKRLTNAVGHVEDRTYDARFGSVATVKKYFGDPNSESQRYLVTTNVIDGFGRKVGENTKGVGTSGTLLSESDVTWAYEGLATTSAVYAVTTVTNTGSWSKVYFDKLQREVAQENRIFDGTTAKALTTYDARGRKSTLVRPMGPGLATTTLSYDDLNRVTSETMSATGLATTTTNIYSGLFSAVHRTNSSGPQRKSVMERDLQGRTKAMTDCLGPGGQDLANTLCTGTPVTTSFTYDATGNALSITTPATPTNPSGITRSATYDKLGRKATSTDPDIGSRTYTYNGAGETVTEQYTQASVPVTLIWYRDNLGRVIRQRTSRQASGNHDATYVFDQCDNSPARFNGVLCQIWSSDQNAFADFGVTTSEDRYFDEYGRTFRVSKKIQADTDPIVEAHSFTLFDAQSRPSQSVQAPSGHSVAYVYNGFASGGFLNEIRDPSGSVTYWRAEERFSDGHIKRMNVGGAIVTQGYDGFGRPESISTMLSGAPVQSGLYTWDALGNLASRSDSANGVAYQAFDYDSLNRVTTNGGATYDDAGNITMLNGIGHVYWPGTNRVQTVQGSTYNYDSVGNLTSGGGRTIAWKAFNMPASVTKAGQTMTWYYGPDLQRVREVSPATGTTLYFPGGERISKPGESVRWRHYITSPEGTVGSVDVVEGSTNASDRRHWLRDHLGSVVRTFNGQTAAFDPVGPLQYEAWTVWGERVTPITLTTTSVQRGFTGHEMLDEVGLVHMNGRIYDPVIGKFLSADPIVQAPLNGQSWNRYSYVMNNPLSGTDPTGYSSVWVQWRRPIGSIAAAVAAQWAVGLMMTYSTTSCIALTAGQEAFAAAAGGFAAGGVAGGNIQSAVQGAIFATMSFGIGEMTGHAPEFGSAAHAANIGMHAVVGCAKQAAAGGTCRGGAMAGGFSALASPIGFPGGSTGKLAAHVAIGAVMSRLSGDRAQNGAVTAAFEYLFNFCGLGGQYCDIRSMLSDRDNEVLQTWQGGVEAARSVRVPDYVQVEGSFVFPSGNLILSQDGDVFYSYGLTRQLEIPLKYKLKFGVSLTFQFIDDGAQLSPSERRDIIGGQSAGGMVCAYMGCVGRQWSASPSGPVGTTAVGVGSPGVSGGVSNSEFWFNVKERGN